MRLKGNVVVISGGTELDPHVKVYEDKAAYEKAPRNKDERVLTVPKRFIFRRGVIIVVIVTIHDFGKTHLLEQMKLKEMYYFSFRINQLGGR